MFDSSTIHQIKLFQESFIKQTSSNYRATSMCARCVLDEWTLVKPASLCERAI